MSDPTTVQRHANRLIHETSPYLLQHAHNPVDWYSWGPEAFEAARQQDKPIFLSIGYSTCYWCHVMERQCFENEPIAREMNSRFINIKVDREERPDVDLLYMTAVQVLTRQGGWPLSVFLTPDLRPFYGGTYFPPVDAHGRPGFVTVLRAIEETYRNRKDEVEQTCGQLVDILEQLAEPQPPESPMAINDAVVGELVDHSISDYDERHGGFGGAPKFPRQTLLEMLLVYMRDAPIAPAANSPARVRKQRIERMLRQTLDAMADGGIRDQLGGGFHRYSTDASWLVPHFEIMLYDNAMLAWIYAEASRQFKEPRYGAVARGIIEFVLREMASPEGVFYTAFDAEVDAIEGGSYLWTADEIDAALGRDDARLFKHAYGLDLGPNFADPHHGSGVPDRNILYLPKPLPKAAAEMGIRPGELEQQLDGMRRKLYEVRKQRKQPMLDTKILTSWNALMIRALAHAGSCLGEPRYLQAATRAADWLVVHHAAPDGSLWRGSRDGATRHEGFLDDHAFLAQALIELGQAGGQRFRREQAQRLAHVMIDRFGDGAGRGFYFTSAGAHDIIARQKTGSDTPLPSGNAVAAMVMLELDQDDVARDVLATFARHLEATADSMSAMVQAAIGYLKTNEPFTVSPGPWQPAAGRPTSPREIAAGAVTVDARWVNADELHLNLGILGGFHINAHEAGKDMVATRVTVQEEAASAIEEVEYPPGEPRRFAYADEPLRIYEGAATIAVRFNRSMRGQSPLRLALTYQACSEDACFPAVTRQVEVTAP